MALNVTAIITDSQNDNKGSMIISFRSEDTSCLGLVRGYLRWIERSMQFLSQGPESCRWGVVFRLWSSVTLI